MIDIRYRHRALPGILFGWEQKNVSSHEPLVSAAGRPELESAMLKGVDCTLRSLRDRNWYLLRFPYHSSTAIARVSFSTFQEPLQT